MARSFLSSGHSTVDGGRGSSIAVVIHSLDSTLQKRYEWDNLPTLG